MAAMLPFDADAIAPKNSVREINQLAGRSGRARTCDPRFWRPVLYQLSYTPVRAGVAAGPRRFKHRGCPDCKGEARLTPCSRAAFCARLWPSRQEQKGETMTPQAATKHAAAPQTPPLPHAKPEPLGPSPARLQRMPDPSRGEIDKGTWPGSTVMVARRGQIGWFDALGRQSPAAAAPMAHDTLFRIFSMTKPIVSIGIMMLLEDGHFILNDPVAKFIPEFADQKVGVENNGKLDLVPLKRPMTIQDLLRHTSGITYDHTGNSLVQQLYQQSRLRSRQITNAEHAALVASLPLMCQPGAEWNYSRSTDILGRIIEVVSGKTLGAFLTERILAPLQMAETAFHTSPENV